MSEWPLCNCNEMWGGKGNHGPFCPVVDRFVELLESRRVLMEAAEKQLTKLACAGVGKLTELAPDMGWDSGESVAAHYIAELPDND